MKTRCSNILLACTALGLGICSSAAAGYGEERLTLSDAMEMAIDGNQQYKSARLVVDGDLLELEKAKKTALPTFDLQADYTRYSDPMMVYPIHQRGNFPAFDRNIMHGGLYMNMPLYTGGKLTATQELAQSQIERDEYRKSNLGQELLFSVIRSYAELLMLSESMRAAEKRVRFYEKERDRIALLGRNGRATRLDEAKILSALEGASYDEIQLHAAFDKSRIQLETLINRPVPADVTLESFEIDMSEVPASLERAVAIAEQEYPALRAIAADIDVAAKQVEITNSGSRPKVSMTGGIRNMTGANSTGRNEWQLGIQLSMPLFDGGVNDVEVREAYLAKERTQLSYDYAHHQIVAALRNAFDAVKSSRKGVEVAKAGYAQAEEAMRIEGVRYEVRRSTINDFMASESQFWDSQSRLSRAQGDLMINQAQLLKSMGMLTLTSVGRER